MLPLFDKPRLRTGPPLGTMLRADAPLLGKFDSACFPTETDTKAKRARGNSSSPLGLSQI